MVYAYCSASYDLCAPGTVDNYIITRKIGSIRAQGVTVPLFVNNAVRSPNEWTALSNTI